VANVEQERLCGLEISTVEYGHCLAIFISHPDAEIEEFAESRYFGVYAVIPRVEVEFVDRVPGSGSTVPSTARTLVIRSLRSIEAVNVALPGPPRVVFSGTWTVLSRLTIIVTVSVSAASTLVTIPRIVRLVVPSSFQTGSAREVIRTVGVPGSVAVLSRVVLNRCSTVALDVEDSRFGVGTGSVADSPDDEG